MPVQQSDVDVVDDALLIDKYTPEFTSEDDLVESLCLALRLEVKKLEEELKAK